MTEHTIVAVYDNASHADAAVRDLESIGVPSSAIARHSGASTTGQTVSSEPAHEKGFWSSLFGGDSGHEEVYSRSMTEGSSVVTVKAADEHVQPVSDVLERHNPVDMDERAAAYGVGTGSTTTTTTTGAGTTDGVAPVVGGATTPGGTLPASGAMASDSRRPVAAGGTSTGGEEVLALSEEQLSVGKRLVNHGTTRIRRFVVETPVEEAVTLHSEQVSIERRPVSAGTKATEAAFTDRTIEVSESDEEAVVGKTTHVTEEVVVNKAATERTETVRDTVRHEEVEITKDGTAEPASDRVGKDTAPGRSAV